MLQTLNSEYIALHGTREEAFWALQTGLGDIQTAEKQYLAADTALTRWRTSTDRLKAVEAALAALPQSSPKTTQTIAFEGWLAFFRANVMPADAAALWEEIADLEGQLRTRRAKLDQGFQHPRDGFRSAGGNELRLMVSNDPDPAVRRAAWQGLLDIERQVIDCGFLDLIDLRNRLGRLLGGQDFYDAQVRRVEGMSKRRVFDYLDAIEAATRQSAQRAIQTLAAQSGADAATPWNIDYLTTGDTTREQDPWFPFSAAVDRWAATFSALGIRYRDAQIVCDLVARSGKHDNGFCHGPRVAWRDGGQFQPAWVQFTANAIPGMVGSGRSATRTLFHEGGHAAHFANIDRPAPCFGQEFAPTSVAMAETQSMFLDALLSDPVWQLRYAHTLDGEPMPQAMIEDGVTRRQPFAAWQLRAMLAICYGERALYEMDTTGRTPDRVIETLAKVESGLLFMERSPRPTLSVPHLLSTDSSAYYHGYVLALMAVHQTRQFFLERDGHIVDNPRVGPALAEGYWQPGNQLSFETFVSRMTGQPLTEQALARHVSRSPQQALKDARAALAQEPEVPRPQPGPPVLNARLKVVHGAETVATSQESGIEGCGHQFSEWIHTLEAAKKAP